MMVYRSFGKRSLDVAAGLFGLALLSPVMAAIAIAIIWEDGRPVIFRQTRIGAGASPFVFLKFRSMTTGTPDVASIDATELRVTRVGRVIRRSSLDELPQLINILRGDMSLVGPRPAIRSQTALIAARETAGVLAVRPGLTGLAQVESYDRMSESHKVAFDAQYVNHVSFLSDIWILVRTIRYLTKPPPTY